MTENEFYLAMKRLLPGHEVRDVGCGGVAVYPPGWTIKTDAGGGRFVRGALVTVSDEAHTRDGRRYGGRLVALSADIECRADGSPTLGTTTGPGSHARLPARKFPDISAVWYAEGDELFLNPGVSEDDLRAVADDLRARIDAEVGSTVGAGI